MIAEIKQSLMYLAGENLAVIILTGAGDHSFSIGASINEQSKNSPEANKTYFSELYTMLEMLANMNCPVISAINGYAVGAGFEMALCTDIRIIEEHAIMGAVAVNLGLIFCTQKLPRLVGSGRAKELLFTGRHIPAREALDLDLAEYLTPAHMALSKAQEIAEIIVSKDRYNVQCIKKAVDRGLNLEITQAMKVESDYLFKMFYTDNYRNRVKKFIEKK